MNGIKPEHLSSPLVLKTSCDNDRIIQELYSKQEGVEQRLTQWICDTREKAVRDALIELGWTPPKEGN